MSGKSGRDGLPDHRGGALGVRGSRENRAALVLQNVEPVASKTGIKKKDGLMSFSP